ncbi:MAG: MgtC/SapB family protein [Patescibacteria group bacterium]
MTMWLAVKLPLMIDSSLLGPMFVRLILAAIFGALLGLERTIAGKHAGLRTYALVSLGSALFIIISELVIKNYSATPPIALDPLRIASQVVMGIGFLGAGLIIFKESKISGLTTAAGLWVAAGIGVATGFGLIALAGFATVLALIIFTLFWLFEKRFKIWPHEN